MKTNKGTPIFCYSKICGQSIEERSGRRVPEMCRTVAEHRLTVCIATQAEHFEEDNTYQFVNMQIKCL